jgi:hypothetical protein
MAIDIEAPGADEAALIAALAALLADTYQAKDADLTAIAALTTTAYGRALLALADEAALATVLSSTLALKSPLASPTFTGTPAAPTAAVGTNTTQLATTAFARALRAVQVVEATNVTNQSATNANIPIDDTIPQIGEGTQILTASITPVYSTSKIVAECLIPVIGHSAASINLVAAMFLDGGANAVDVAIAFANNYFVAMTPLQHIWAPGDTSAHTVTVRVGGSANSTWFINGASGSRFFGGVSKARLVLTELPQ